MADQPKRLRITDDLVLSSLRQASALYQETLGTQGPAAPDRTGDGVLAKLRQAEELYVQFQARWEQQVADLLEARRNAAELEEANVQLARAITETRRNLDEERAKARSQQERSTYLATLVRDIHRSATGGNVYDLILKACLTITGATRGVYLTAQQPDDLPQLRAAVDVDGYPQAPPSAFLRTLCRAVLTSKDTLVSTETAAAALPAPDGERERFQNFLAAPVVMLSQTSGVIVVADKLQGDFAEEDGDDLLRIGEQAAQAVEDAARQRNIQRSYLATVTVLADALTTRDPYARASGEQAARLARQVARRLGLVDEDRELVCHAALLRDIGKIGICDGILYRPGPLLPAERDLVETHPRIGHDLLCLVPGLERVAAIVLHHHERPDGTGYPDRLEGAAIPLAARIVGAVDAYCAMTSRRSYRQPYELEQICHEFRRGSGTQFDPRVVEVLLSILALPEDRREEGDEAAHCGVLPDFVHAGEENGRRSTPHRDGKDPQ